MTQLSIVEFGDALLRTQDLDPVYVAIASANLDQPTLARLSLAYWCFYSLGTAAKLAEIKQPKKYWDAMMTAAINEGQNPDGSKPWPRGAERRHFRGAQAIQAMGELALKYGTKDAQHAVAQFVQPDGKTSPTYKSVAKAVQSHRGFGEWIAFKVADMSERVLGYPTDFADCHLGIYKDPRQGAAVAYSQAPLSDGNGVLAEYGTGGKLWEYPITDDQLEATVAYYVALWRKKRAKAPGGTPRLVNVQEIETIFCKYKSHLKGHYPVGKDTREVHHGLTGWGDLAVQLQKGLPHGKA